MLKRIIPVSIAMLFCVLARAQDAPVDTPPYEWTVEGDTVESFKAKLVVNRKPDQGNARGTVEAYMGFTDGRDATRKADNKVHRQWDALKVKALAPWEEKLLAKEARDALAKARKDAESRVDYRKAGAAMIATENKQDDGSVQIETLQNIADSYPDKTGKMNESKHEDKQRFTCAKGDDGKWRISRMERWSREWDGAGIEKWSWKQHSGMLGQIYMETGFKVGQDAPPPAQDSAEAAALSLHKSLIARHTNMYMRMTAGVLRHWLDAVETLCMAELRETAKKFAIDQVKMAEDVLPVPPAADSTIDGENGIKLVTLKKFSRWDPAVRISVKQVEGKWVIVEAGIMEHLQGINKPGEYRAMGDVYALPKS